MLSVYSHGLLVSVSLSTPKKRKARQANLHEPKKYTERRNLLDVPRPRPSPDSWLYLSCTISAPEWAEREYSKH